ncbi:MAG: ABC transporter permease subunit [Clostridiales bacterium]
MKTSPVSIIFSHLLLAVLLIVIFLPGAARQTAPPAAMLWMIALAECYYLWRLRPSRRDYGAAGDLACILWLFLLLWEIFTTKLNKLHPVLFPSPENVFNVFFTQYPVLLGGVFSSLQLLALGLAAGLGLGVILGLTAGWVRRLTGIFHPLAQVLTPIPPVIYAPYLVAIMPTFRSASALIIFLGIFWPTFLHMIIRARSVEPKILDSARALGMEGSEMVLQILLPYVLPDVISNLKVTLSTSIMLLLFAEMMGATSGMGYYIINYVHYANYTNVVAGIILVGLVVTVLNKLVGVVQKRAIKWRR